MLMRKVLACAAALFLTVVGWGRVPTQPEVLEVARHLVARESFQGLLPARTVESVAWVALEDDYGVWAVALAPGGHLILSASTKYRALISWSEGPFAIPERASPQYALLLFVAQRAAAAEAGEGAEHPSWGVGGVSLLASPVSLPKDAVIHDPVDTAKWDQDGVMAWYVPGSAPCGCVATAQAQIMHALEWPVYTEGAFADELTYRNKLDEILTTETYAFSPYAKFDYSVMADVLQDYQQYRVNNQQIARLVLLNDILAKMSFKDGGSGAVGPWSATTPWSLEPNSRALDSFTNKTVYTKTDIDAIRQAMADGVPIACTVPGHAIVASGYAQHDNEPYVRLNYGWGGGSNGWYHVNHVEEYAITYPTRTVQCDPLPAVSSGAVKLAWHLPKCYGKKVKGFTIEATQIPETVSGSISWTDPFTQFTGDKAGNTRALGMEFNQLKIAYPDIKTTAPKVLYTWAPIFVPTAETVWSVDYQHWYNRGPIHFQVLPLDACGVWETVSVIDPGTGYSPSPWETLQIKLSKYAGIPCKFRLFVYPTVHENVGRYGFTEFALKNMAVRNLAQVLTTATRTIDVEGSDVRSYTFAENDLSPGMRYAFTVTPRFEASETEGTKSTPCATRIANEAFPEETFAALTISSPSPEAWQTSSMLMDGNYRHCTYSGRSILRVKTDLNIKTIELHSSHPTAFPDAAFTVERYGDGYFDIFIDSTKMPSAPRLNDRLNLSVIAVSEAGTRTIRELDLQFTASTIWASNETAVPPELVAITYTAKNGMSYAIPRSWFDDCGLADRANTSEYLALMTQDSDEDGHNNAEEYLARSNPQSAASKLAITSLTIHADGTASVVYAPQPDPAIADVTLQGKAQLSSGEWETHDVQSRNHRFFRVLVTPKVN